MYSVRFVAALLLIGVMSACASFYNPHHGVIDQRLSFRLIDRRETHTTLMIYENGMVSCARLGRDAKIRYINSPMIYRHITVAEAKRFTLTVMRLARLAGHKVEAPDGHVYLTVHVMLPHRREDFSYYLESIPVSGPVKDLHDFIFTFIQQHQLLDPKPQWIPKNAPHLSKSTKAPASEVVHFTHYVRDFPMAQMTV
ncbi:MAG: hypothetical protein ABI318_23375 [Chthoniobacteraceae bacterium]